MIVLDPDDMIGRSYLSVPGEDGTRTRLHIIEALDRHANDSAHDKHMIKFRASNTDQTVEDIITYNDLLDRIEADDGEDDVWRFEAIMQHQGPLKASHPDYKGSRWNVLIKWENGEQSWEPLGIIARSDPVSCAIYGKTNKLLEQTGWKQFARLAKRQKKFVRMANQAKLFAYRLKITYKFGVRIPQNHKEAMELDKANGNELWKNAEKLELAQIDDYEVFEDLGRGAKAPEGYRKIGVHFVYDCKQDGRRKARLVADGHKTPVPLESVYSGVVSLRGLRIVLFLAELNNLDLWGTDIGNAYLEAKTREKLYIIAGPEFGDRAGHTLIVQRALYGLRLSGKMWGERSSDVFRAMGFVQSRTQDDIWMRNMGDHYEYIARYVDDLAIASRNPKAITDALQQEHGFKLKGTGPLGYHLGCGFGRDEDGTLTMSPKLYIDRMIDNYERMFGCKPRATYSSPLEGGDHPELDTSEELDEKDTKKYQGLIGAIQWAVSIGRLDVATAVMTMSRFRANPRKGHMERARRIVGYLSKMKHAIIRFRTSKPDMSMFPQETYGWEYSVYGNVDEMIPTDAPEPKGKSALMITYVDANLMHDILTGRSATGILHFLNQTPIDWFSKKQSTVETATYGSEFVAARTATEQILDLRFTLRYLGVPLENEVYMFGDNESVVKSASIPHSKIHKRHVLLSFHRVREAIASKMLRFIHIKGIINPADILSKHWRYSSIWPMLQALLFWKGDTARLIDSQLGE